MVKYMMSLSKRLPPAQLLPLPLLLPQLPLLQLPPPRLLLLLPLPLLLRLL